MAEVKDYSAYSFELDERMIDQLRQELEGPRTAQRFAEAIQGLPEAEARKAGRKFFEDHGRNWMRRSLQLGEQYPDRTYAVIKEAAAHTGALYFPHVPQRFIEIAFLSAHGIYFLPMVENNQYRLIFKLDECGTYRAIAAKCGEPTAKLMLCRYGCLAACQTACRDLKVNATLSLEATVAKEGYCQFALRRH